MTPAPMKNNAMDRLCWALGRLWNSLSQGGFRQLKEQTFAEFEALHPDDPQSVLLAKAIWLTGRGQAYARAGRLFQALDCYSDAMTIKRDHIPAYLGLAMTYRRLGQSSGGWGFIGAAVDLLRKLPNRVNILGREINLELFGSALYCEWATLHIIMGEREQAVEALVKALRFHEEARRSSEEDRTFLAASGFRLDLEYAGNMRHTLAELGA